MKRAMLLICYVVLGIGFAAAGGGLAVPPNGNPAPGLDPASVCYPTCVSPTDIVAADFNQDGWLDLAVSCSATGNVFYYASTGFPRNVFRLPVAVPAGSLPNAFPFATFLLAGTFNAHDGYPDLTVVHAAAIGKDVSGISVISRAAGGFPTAAPLALVNPPLVGPIIHIAAGNLNNDNVTDLVYLTAAGGNALLSGPGGAYTQELLPGWPAGEKPVASAIADFDQNGWDDVAVVTEARNLYVWFYAPYATPAGFSGPLGPIAVAIPVPTAIAAGDFGRDGFPDIVVVGNQLPPNNLGQPTGLAQVFGNQIHQTEGESAGKFQGLDAMLTWGFNARDVVTLDADGNGRDDFAVCNWGSSTVTVFLSDARGITADTRETRDQCLNKDGMKEERLKISFQLFKYELRCGFYPIALAAGDFDRNGKADLAVALQSATQEPCAQNPSCIEIIYDAACGFATPPAPVVGQIPHNTLPPAKSPESTSCPDCKTAEEQPSNSGK